MRIAGCLVVLSLVLAGCSGGGKDKAPEDDPFVDAPTPTSGKGLIRGLVLTPAIAPIPGVLVSIASIQQDRTTDANGAFVFSDLEPGTYFLQVAKPGWTSVQQSAEVVANVQEPPIVKISIEKIPGAEPRVVTLQADGFMACSFGTPINYGSCSLAQEENPDVYFDIEGVPRWIQTEIIWESTQPSGDWLYVVQGICSCDGGVPDVGGARFDEVPDATTNHVAWATPEFLTEHGVGGEDGKQLVVSVSASGPEPETTNGSGVAYSQAFSVYATFFYNFDPDPSWSFGANGAYEVPPS